MLQIFLYLFGAESTTQIKTHTEVLDTDTNFCDMVPSFQSARCRWIHTDPYKFPGDSRWDQVSHAVTWTGGSVPRKDLLPFIFHHFSYLYKKSVPEDFFFAFWLERSTSHWAVLLCCIPLSFLPLVGQKVDYEQPYYSTITLKCFRVMV